MTGLIAAYESEAAANAVLDRLRSAGLTEMEVYSPIGLESDELGTNNTLIAPLTLAGGIIGAAFMFGLETLATATSWGYPIDIGGRPEFSWPAYIPIAFAFGLLSAGASALVGYMLHSLPWRLWDPVDEFESLSGASRDRWIVHISSEDERLLGRARAVLGATGPVAMRPMSHDLEEVPA